MATPSGEGAGGATAARSAYFWPEGDGLEARGAGGDLALGFVPHSNEPLGTALLGWLEAGGAAPAGLLWLPAIDPPPVEARFALPGSFLEYLERFHLPPIADQVEFAHTHLPRRPAEVRAARLRRILRIHDIRRLALFHNDPFGEHPYVYAAEADPALDQALREGARGAFAPVVMPRRPFTEKLSELTYRYFPVSRVAPDAPAEAAGVFLPRELGIEARTIELPMFDWRGVSREVRLRLIVLHQAVVAQGLPPGAAARRELLSQAESIGAAGIPMIPAETTLRVQLSALRALASRRAPELPLPTL